MSFDPNQFRAEFPLLQRQVHGVPLVYLDNAATTQKPSAVIQALERHYLQHNANVHRASHAVSAEATQAFENARETLRSFISAAHTQEIIWTRGATEAINLVANSFGASLQPGDEILVSEMEHHANIVPWQLLAERSGAKLRVLPLTAEHTLDLSVYRQLLGVNTKLVAISHASNAIGVVNPVAQIIAEAKAVGAVTLVDGAQAVAHLPVDVQTLGCDFYVFSGHKMFGPTGIGVLYGRKQLLEAMPPWQGGGEMIETVSFSETRFNRLPFKFEAGTPNIAGAIALAAAAEFIQHQDRAAMHIYEQTLVKQLRQGLQALQGVRVFAADAESIGAVSFCCDTLHAQDLGTLLDQQGIAVRTGHHCAMPLMQALNTSATVRVSLAAYNTPQEVEQFLVVLNKLLCNEELVQSVEQEHQQLEQDLFSEARLQPDYASLLEQLNKQKGWEGRYRQLMMLGKQLVAYPDLLRSELHQVPGCESQMWLAHERSEGRFWFLADSDARIVKGLATLVVAAYNGKTAEEIIHLPIEQEFESLGLIRHLSPSRGNGLKAIVARIRELASEAL